MAPTLRIAISPSLRARFGAEIDWTWRLLLTGIGWSWNEVGTGEPCDIAYVVDRAEAPQARLCIEANPTAWEQPAAYRFGTIGRAGDLVYLHFVGEAQVVPPGNGERRVCAHDIVFDVFWLLTGQEELYWPKNTHGFCDLTGTPVATESLPSHALGSQIAVWLESRMRALGQPPPEPPWPNGKQAAAAASHDVDYPEVIRWLEPLRIVRRLGARGVGPALEVLSGRRTNWGFPFWTKLERELGARSAFYFVPRQGSLFEYATGLPDTFYDVRSDNFRRLFQELAGDGFEIGMHASYLAYRDRERFAAEKRHLEEAVGRPIHGGRHHYFHLNPEDVEETLLMHEQIGLQYDTSLSHERYVGWRRGWSQPFFPFHQRHRRELQTLQMTTAWMDDQLFGHRGDNPGDADAILDGLVTRVLAQHGCLMVDVHEYVFDDARYPGWAAAYRRLWASVCGRGDVWVATPGEIATHWRSRYRGLVDASTGLGDGRG